MPAKSQSTTSIAAGAFSLNSTDFNEFANAFRQWNIRFNQLSRGAFLGQIDLIQARAIQLLRISLNQVIQARGTHRPGTYGFCPIVASNENAVWRGHHLRQGHILMIGPHERTDHLTCKPYTTLMLNVQSEALFEAGRAQGINVDELVHDKLAVALPREKCLAFNNNLNRILDHALLHKERWTPKYDRRTEAACLRALVTALAHAQPNGTIEIKSSNHVRQMRLAEAYIAARLHQHITINKLCQEIHVSERSLHYLFQKLHRMSPMAYVKVKRLNSIREELKATRLTNKSIAAIAKRWGLWHSGDFAAAYRRLFGELPSQTYGRGS